jgi:prepilin-type N-terminal cleavage/methylation domain-containing protein
MKRHHRAFTLLELLLALAITVILASTLASSLYVGFRGQAATNRAISAGHATGIVADVITRDLACALPPNGVLAADFQGQPSDILFYATGTQSDAVVQGDVRQIEYTLNDTGNGTNELIRRVDTNLLRQVSIDPPQQTVARNVTRFELSYYDGSAWQDAWDATTHSHTLPLAVQVTLEVTSPGSDPVRFTRIVSLACGVASTSSTTGGAQ